MIPIIVAVMGCEGYQLRCDRIAVVGCVKGNEFIVFPAKIPHSFDLNLTDGSKTCLII